MGINVFELDDGIGVAFETVFLDKERYEDAIDLKDQIVGIDAIEHVVVEEKADLSPHTVRLA